MSPYKDEIKNLGRTTLLTNPEIANVVGCSLKTVSKYIGSYAKRCKQKVSSDVDAFKIQRTILLPDIHSPHYKEKLMESVNKFIFDYEPDEIVYMGDQVSLDSISYFNKNKPLLKEGQRLIKDYNEFDKNILQIHENITRMDIRRTFMIGNHEYRVDRYIEEHPELEGLIDITQCLKLKERGYNVIPYNHIYKIGKLNIIHGYYYNIYHAKKTVEDFEGNVVYAHVHSPQMFTKHTPVDRKGYHTATSLPCLCNLKPDYKKNLPNFWVNGFGIIEHVPATGHFNLYTIIIIDGCFIYNGVYYGKDF